MNEEIIGLKICAVCKKIFDDFDEDIVMPNYVRVFGKKGKILYVHEGRCYNLFVRESLDRKLNVKELKKK